MIMAVVLGLLSGLVMGALGAGGSLIMVPSLIYGLGLVPKDAMGITHLIIGMGALGGAIEHTRHGNVMWQAAIPTALTAMIGAYFGAKATEFVPETLLLIMFSVLVLLAAGAMFRPLKIKDPSHSKITPGILKPITAGLVLGFMTGLVGVGGGFLFVPCLTLFCGVDIRRAIGTSLVIIGLKATAAFAGSMHHLEVSPSLVASVGVPALIGSLLGASLNRFLKISALRFYFAVLLIMIGVSLLISNVIRLVSG